MRKFRTGENIKTAEPKSKEFILTISGYASTNAVDSYDEIVKPSAFGDTMTSFMEFPVLLVNHLWFDKPVGKVIDYKIDQKGLWIEAGIADTIEGRDVKTLVESDILKAFSIGYSVPEGGYVENEEDEPNEIEVLDLWEISIVNVPANREALVEAIKKKDIKLKSLSLEGGGKTKRSKTMSTIDPEKMQEQIKGLEAELATAKKGNEEAQVTLSDIKDKIGDLMVFKKAVEDIPKGIPETEVDERIDRIKNDFLAEMNEVNDRIKDIKQTKLPHGPMSEIPYDYKSLMMKPDDHLKAVLNEDAYCKVARLRKMNDDVILATCLLRASSGAKDGLDDPRYGKFHTKPWAENVKSLKLWEEFNEFAKAMYSTYSGYGDEFVPTVLSSELFEHTKLAYRAAQVFTDFDMWSNPCTIPADGSDTIAVIASEQTSVITALADSTEQTPPTAKYTFTAEKLRARYQVATELVEDSAIAIIPFARNKIVRSMSRAVDQAILNGQETADIDTGASIGSTDARKLVDGLRYAAEQHTTSARIDMSTFSEDTLRDVRAGMVAGTAGDPYGVYPEELVIFCSAKCYLKHFLKDLDSVLTLDKYGPNAVVLTGELMRFDNIPIIPHPLVADNLDANGVQSGSSDIRTVLIMVHTPSFRIGYRRRIEVLTHFNPFYDVTSLIAFLRMDFQPMATTSSNHVVNTGYNIST
ncbi:MAG: HK97 family phage prohead protease [Phycisphaerales bacterium]|jgi:HK97 family phage prohead protease